MLRQEWTLRAAPRAGCRLLALAFFVFVGHIPSAAAAPPDEIASPASAKSCEVRDFDILVDRRRTGTHRLTITTAGSVTTTQVESDVHINLVVYSYTYKFRATEVWRENRLAQLDVQCDDGGKRKDLTARVEGDISRVTLNGRAHQTDRGQISTAYWQLPAGEAPPQSVSILDVNSGLAKPATLERVGKTTVQVEGQSLDCQHIKIGEPVPTELWFDDQNRLVRQTSVVEGHPTELRLRRIHQPGVP